MKHYFVTGGSRGIGAAVCRDLASGGDNISFTYATDKTAAAVTVSRVRTAGGTPLACLADVSDPASLAAAFDTAQATFGPFAGVVINAGIIGPVSPLAEMEPERIARVIEVNVTGALYTAREAARRMSTSRGGQGGAIVIVSSAAARLGSPNEFVDYAASKGAIDTLTLGLAKELGPEGIRVNGVRPGLIETDIHAAAGVPDRAARLGAGVPLGRSGSAQEVAEPITWLLTSPDAAYVTGALLDIAGGR
ncbi:MAG: SDR family oxidoreductase [Pseudomonadota bacterium]